MQKFFWDDFYVDFSTNAVIQVNFLWGPKIYKNQSRDQWMLCNEQ